MIRGETDHYEHIAREAAGGLAAVARETGVPVGFGVLTVRREAHALARAGRLARTTRAPRRRGRRCETVHALRALQGAAAAQGALSVGRRTKARECAFQILYQWQISGEPIERGARRASGACARHARGARDGRAAGARRRRRRAEALDAEIAEAATHWRIERIAPVDRTILRLGAYELAEEKETPAAVVIDEAVELAKRFGEADSPAFVNGVLDAIRKRVRREAGARRGGREAAAMSDEETPPVPGWPQESAQRLLKARALRELGVEPYPTRFERSHRLGEVVAAHGERTLEELEALAADGEGRRPRAHEARARQGVVRDARRRRRAAAGLRALRRRGGATPTGSSTSSTSATSSA